MSSQTVNRRSPWLLAALWISVFVAVAVVLRRLFALLNPSPTGPPQMVALDRDFAGHTALTLAHILPALIFALLAPFVLLRRDSAWLKELLLAIGTVVGISAFGMA